MLCVSLLQPLTFIHPSLVYAAVQRFLLGSVKISAAVAPRAHSTHVRATSKSVGDFCNASEVVVLVDDAVHLAFIVRNSCSLSLCACTYGGVRMLFHALHILLTDVRTVHCWASGARSLWSGVQNFRWGACLSRVGLALCMCLVTLW